MEIEIEVVLLLVILRIIFEIKVLVLSKIIVTIVDEGVGARASTVGGDEGRSAGAGGIGAL